MAKIIVTGGAGYIGSHCAKLLKKRGHEPIVLDDLSTGHKEFLKFGKFHEVDLCDLEKLQKVFSNLKDVHGVIHFAGRIIVPESVEKPDLYFRSNILASMNLLKVMNESGIKNLIISSTAAVYGTPKSVPIREDQELNPLSPYGDSKLFMEKMAAAYRAQFKFNVVCLRYFNVMGGDPEKEVYEWHEPETHLIPNILMAHKEGRAFQLYGKDYETSDGTCIRDYVDVMDLAQVHVEAMERITKEKFPFTMNVGRGQGFSNLEIVSAIEKVTKKKVEVKFAERRAGDPARLVADTSLFKKHFPEFKFKSLEESLGNLV